MLHVLEKATCLHLILLISFSDPPGMFSASEQWEVHPAGPADGAHAAGAQIPPPSAGARALLQGLASVPPCLLGVGRSCFQRLGSRTLWEEGGSWRARLVWRAPKRRRQAR